MPHYCWAFLTYYLCVSLSVKALGVYNVRNLFLTTTGVAVHGGMVAKEQISCRVVHAVWLKMFFFYFVLSQFLEVGKHSRPTPFLLIAYEISCGHRVQERISSDNFNWETTAASAEKLIVWNGHCRITSSIDFTLAVHFWNKLCTY